MKHTTQGEYSVSKPRDSKKIFNIIIKELCLLKNFNNDLSNVKITDATAGNGGDTITFAKKNMKVLAIEKNINEYNMLIENLNTFNVHIRTINDSCLNHICKNYQDILYMDPPWGGPDYVKQNNIALKIDDLSIISIVKKILLNNHALITAIKAPFNFEYEKFQSTLKLYNIYSTKYNVAKYYIIISKKM